ncbi:HNH endonuclease family protein [Chloroflexota bacterium]
MQEQRVLDIDFKSWVIAQIPSMISNNEIYINKSYQRGDIWKSNQKAELIKSIKNGYSIGVIVLYVNDKKQYEILDGQQRILTIQQYLEGNVKFKDAEVIPYCELKFKEKTLFDAYPVFYIRLISQRPDSKEEDVMQTFLRLQEGTPLNKAEKLNAYRGKFKNTFRDIRETHPIFTYLGNEKRFRWRQLAAELLTLEVEGDFNNKVFPSLDLKSMINIVQKHESILSNKKVNTFKSNLDFLHRSLNVILTAFQPREFISFYLLLSYLRKYKADNENLMNEFSGFTEIFLQYLNSFAIYDKEPPPEMKKEIFDEYMSFKLQSKVMTTQESIKKRLEIMLREYDRLHPIIIKDPDRLFDVEQKRTLYFRQKGVCGLCGKKMIFRRTTGHHIIRHSKGGRTEDIDKAVLLHEHCHTRVEKLIDKGKTPIFPFKS